MSPLLEVSLRCTAAEQVPNINNDLQLGSDHQ